MTAVFESWTFSLPLPEPVRTMTEAAEKKVSTDPSYCSVHNDRKRARKATLHGPTLRAMDCLEEVMEHKTGACGIQTGTNGAVYYFLETEKEAKRLAFLYNPANGGFLAMVPEELSLELDIEKGKANGKYLLAMLAYVSLEDGGNFYDEEFAEQFSIYRREKPKANEAFLKAAYICCDNLYRRVLAKKLPCSAEVAEGKIGKLDLEEVRNELYVPNRIRFGEFQVFLTAKTAPVRTLKTVGDIRESYLQHVTLTEEEQGRIPKIPDDYLVSKEAESILKKATKTGMRIFMLRGDAGKGKTTDAKIVARCLGLPYYSLCCGEGTEETDLITSYVPNTGRGTETFSIAANWDAFMLDPASAVCEMTGEYEEGMDFQTAFQRILQEAFAKGQKAAREQKDFLMVESELVKGCRRPAVVEIQEPAVIGRPGTLVKLNSLLDDCASITLSDGEIVRRHPDSVFILTTNAGYQGCKPMDQSVISRMHMVYDSGALTPEEMAKRAEIKTGCKDSHMLLKMAKLCQELTEKYSDVIAMGGVCGYREYEDWVAAWTESGDLLEELKAAVISKMTDQKSIQEEIHAFADAMLHVYEKAA